jgi:hypothetical protein
MLLTAGAGGLQPIVCCPVDRTRPGAGDAKRSCDAREVTCSTSQPIGYRCGSTLS